MWVHTLRSARPKRPIRAAGRFPRRYQYNGQSQIQGGHTTYFQQPPPDPPRPRRRIFRSLLIGTTLFGLGAFAHSALLDVPFFGIGILGDEDMVDSREAAGALNAAAQDMIARRVPIMALPLAQEFLEMRGAYSVAGKVVGHSCQLPSNLPCEDTEHAGLFSVLNDESRDWATWGIYDGHAGPRTAQILKENLAYVVGGYLADAGCMDRPYVPNDPHVIETIKKAFNFVDEGIMKEGVSRAAEGEGDFAHTLALLAPALSGSCALMAVFDPARAMLRVANTGDSRAVLGRWDSGEGKYVAQLMSHDHTGFNADEVERLQRDHPGEDPVDPKTGRVFGIAVSRAFGDSRWKWPNDLSKLVHDKFWGPAPRPNGVIQTPPYLTAEPEVIETRVQAGAHPDFLIMASDGLWDNISSQDAVTCVQMWLERNNPTAFLDKPQPEMNMAQWFKQELNGTAPENGNGKGRRMTTPTYTKLGDMTEDEDTYFDERDGCLRWRTSPKHFVVEDENCGVHLIKNVLGGKRRSLFCGIMSMQPPLSRNVRDDITVHVVFFGQDGQPAIAN